jgi:hypothetical protein
VPTRTIVEEILAAGTAPPYAMTKLRAIADRHAAALTMAHESGVTIAMGTDIACTGAPGTERQPGWRVCPRDAGG